MSRTTEFVSSLHLLAASGDSAERQRTAVEAIFGRFIEDARDLLGKDEKRIRGWVVSLQNELTVEPVQPRADRYADLRNYALEIVVDWLQNN